MIDIDEVLKRLSDGDDDIVCREYELRPQIIAKLIENVAQNTKSHGYVIIGISKKTIGYDVNGIDAGIDIEHLVRLAFQKLQLQIQVEYLVQYWEKKRICIILVERYFDDIKGVTTEIKPIKRDEIFKAVIKACISLQKNVTFRNVSEDQRNDFVRDILEASGFQIKDQTRQGISSAGKASGEVDILLHDKGNPISIIEALNLNGMVVTYLDEHIDKIYKYDTAGNEFNFIISYVKVKNFGEFWDKYVIHIKNYSYPYTLLHVEDSLNNEYNYTDIRYITTIHDRNGKETILYHICLKIID